MGALFRIDSSNVGLGVGLGSMGVCCVGSGVLLTDSGVVEGGAGVFVHRSDPWGAKNIWSEEVREGNEHDKVTKPMKIMVQSM
jgi:hypothetical protein